MNIIIIKTCVWKSYDKHNFIWKMKHIVTYITCWSIYMDLQYKSLIISYKYLQLWQLDLTYILRENKCYFFIKYIHNKLWNQLDKIIRGEMGGAPSSLCKIESFILKGKLKNRFLHERVRCQLEICMRRWGVN